MTDVWQDYVERDGVFAQAQLTLAQPLAHPFSGLGLERCQHESRRGVQCATLGTWDGLHGRVLCDEHANEAA